MRFRIRELRKSKGLKQVDLVEMTGLSNPYLSTLETGNQKKSPSVDALARIASALGVRIGDLFDDARPVAVAGRVGAGARVPLVDGYEKGDGLYHVACPADLPFSDALVAVEIVGDSMAPVYEDGDLLFYSRKSLGVPTEAIGSKCVCEDENGDVWVKQLKRGSAPGLFHLVSLNPTAENMHDVQIKWAAPIVMHLPKALVQPMDG